MTPFPTRTALPFVLIATLLAGAGAAQDPGTTGSGGSATPPKPQDGTTATPTAAEGDATQDPKPSPVERLAAAVDAAHRPDERLREISFSAFRDAHFQIASIGRKEDSIAIELRAAFCAPRYIRYRIEEQGRVYERGYDSKGGWTLVDDELTPLRGKEKAAERRVVLQHARLARQLLTFLAPGKVVRGLRDVTGIADHDLKPTRRTRVACRVVEGIVDDFPRYFSGENAKKPEHGVRLRLWVAKETDLLVGVEARVLDEDGRPDVAGEFVYLRDPSNLHGVQVPTRLTIYEVLGATWQPRVDVTVSGLILQVDGDPADLARPKS